MNSFVNGLPPTPPPTVSATPKPSLSGSFWFCVWRSTLQLPTCLCSRSACPVQAVECWASYLCSRSHHGNRKTESTSLSGQKQSQCAPQAAAGQTEWKVRTCLSLFFLLPSPVDHALMKASSILPLNYCLFPVSVLSPAPLPEPSSSVAGPVF